MEKELTIYFIDDLMFHSEGVIVDLQIDLKNTELKPGVKELIRHDLREEMKRLRKLKKSHKWLLTLNT